MLAKSKHFNDILVAGLWLNAEPSRAPRRTGCQPRTSDQRKASTRVTCGIYSIQLFFIVKTKNEKF